MVNLRDPSIIKIAFYALSFVVTAVFVYNILKLGPSYQNILGLVADIFSILVFLVFQGLTISDILRKKTQIEVVKKDISSFVENYLNIFSQLFVVLVPNRAYIRKVSEEIKSKYEKKCETGEFEQLNSELKLRIANEIMLQLLSNTPALHDPGIKNFLIYIILKKLGEWRVARSFIDELDEESILNERSWQYTFCRCSLLYHENELDFTNLNRRFKEISEEEIKEHYHLLKGNLEMYRKLIMIKEDSKYRDLYEALREQIAEILHKHEISHVALRHALASEKTDLVCLIKWAEGGFDVLGDKFEKLGWATPAHGKTIQISPINKSPVTKNFDLNKWVEEKFQLDEIDTPYRLVAIKFNIKDMVVRTYKRSDKFLRDVSEGLSPDKIEELVFSEAESIKELIERADLALLVPNFPKSVKEVIRRKDAKIRKELAKRGFRINSPLDFRLYEDRIEEISQVISNLTDGKRKLFNEIEANQISSAFIKNAKRLAEIALG